MKKALIISLCALLLAGTGCKKNAEPEPQKVAVTGVAVIPRSVTLKVGETKEIIATITPANADNQNVSWSTSNSSVATVATGLVTAAGAGEATITVTTVDGGKTATCAVTVSAVVVPVTGIKIDQGATAEVEEGNTITLTATVQPENATDKTVTWTSSKPEVATVDGGVVTGVVPGEVVITAKAGDKTATCTVTVNSAIPAYEAVDLGLSVKWANKNLGAEFPEDAGDYYAWGELETKPVYSWNSYKFLTAEGGYISKYTMDAWEAATVDYLTLLEEEDDVAHKILGDKWRLPTPAEWNELHNHTNRQNSQNGMYAKASNGNSIFLPYGGMYYSNDGAELYLKGREGFYWTSSLGNINSYARCAWLAGGDIDMSIYIVRSAGLSIRPVYGERPPMPVGYVGLDNTSWEMYPEDQFTLVATVLPESAADKTVTWISSKQEVATVDGGVVTGVAPGEAVITAKAGEKTATCTVTVMEDPTKVTGVWLDKKAATRYLNGVVELKAHVVPSTAGDKSVSWSSSNEAVATVSENGLVTVLAEGETTITVTTTDGGFTDQCQVSVIPTPADAVFSISAFNSSSSDNPILVLQEDASSSTIYRANGTVDLNGHTIRVLYMRNNNPEQSVTVRRGIISNRLDGDAGWYRYTHETFRGKVTLEDMEVYKEFYTDGHVYTINSGYYETVCTFRVGDALGDVYIYGGSFGKLFDVNPDAGSNQGDIFLFGGKFAIDPRTYTNAGTTNPSGNTRFIVGEGYSVKDNTEEDKDEFPYIVSKD